MQGPLALPIGAFQLPNLQVLDTTSWGGGEGWTMCQSCLTLMLCERRPQSCMSMLHLEVTVVAEPDLPRIYFYIEQDQQCNCFYILVERCGTPDLVQDTMNALLAEEAALAKEIEEEERERAAQLAGLRDKISGMGSASHDEL